MEAATSDRVGTGPQHPSRIIFVTTVVVAGAVGLVTGKFLSFVLALVGCAALLCAGYALVRRRLGWKPLDVDYLLHLIGVMHP
ncbi:hypothetical protein DA075_18975 [Methylobacterium currus]|uniref:Uncharacterized protein n=1 Tax=Methylobacterium currus TaxID=2051553 RepID=A0A2R4WMG3_9HYPH|nr:hypothetical protein [Methylobacterium currus]AWB22728.1 hypothetical protein DA075_18975 [Methylobacterium currus]